MWLIDLFMKLELSMDAFGASRADEREDAAFLVVRLHE